MDVLLGNLFRPGQKACLCELRVEADHILAVPRESEEGESEKFPLRADNLSFGGDGGTQLILKGENGSTLYAERAPLQPILVSRGDRDFQDKIQLEDKRMVRAGRMMLITFFGFFLGCGLLLWLGVLGLNWGVDRAVDQIPISWEESLGDVVVSNLEGEITDPRVTEPVKKIVDRIAAAQPGQPYNLELHVVDNPQINAFAAPGGQIVVYTGLLEKAQGPDELAGVLAHEFQHVFRRHGLRNMVHSLKWQMIAALLVGDVGSVQQLVMAHAPQFLSLSYGRSLEEEADLEGAELLMKAQIDPQGMVEFFKTMERNQTVQVPEFLSSHPDTGSRIEELQGWISEQPSGTYEPLDVEWEELKVALNGNSE